MGRSHFVSLLLRGRRFGLAAPHRSTSRIRSFAISGSAEQIARSGVAEPFVQLGQDARRVISLLSAMHHHVARIGQLARRDGTNGFDGQRLPCPQRDVSSARPERDPSSAPSGVGRTWWTSQPTSTGMSLEPNGAQIATSLSPKQFNPSTDCSRRRLRVAVDSPAWSR